MAMSAGTAGGVKASPNVTPMIDVMLVLLIIFMLVIPAITAGFQAIPPMGTNLKPHPEEDQDQVLGIDAKGQYYLNKKAIPNAELAQRLNAIFENRTEDKLLYIKAHKDLDYGKVLDAMDIAAHNHVTVTGMITDQRPGTVSLVPQDNMFNGPAKGGAAPAAGGKK
jgi:biopolymer transport protein TolR